MGVEYGPLSTSKRESPSRIDLMRSTIAGCILVVAMCLVPGAQNREADNDESGRILSLENAWNQAEVKHDTRALGFLIAETFEYTDSDGRFMNRSQWLAQVKNPVNEDEQIGNSGMKVHVYGNAAVVTGEYREKMKVRGKTVMRSGRFTDTWIRQNGEWKCVASQETLISPRTSIVPSGSPRP